jgi:predicted HAD superfamily Cof-like phosphohydrolase
MTQKTDYQKVCDFNKVFDFPQYDNFENNKCLKLRFDLIEEELSELKTAYNTSDFIEEMDACADILYVAYGMTYTYKIDSDTYLNYLIKDNNLSLFQNIKNNIFEFKSKLDLIQNIDTQFKKLTECCYANNKEWVNALHNIIIYVYDFQVIAKYDSDKIFTLVHESNMSKLCKTEEEAKQTVDKYKYEYENKTSPYDSPYYYQLTDGAYSGYYIVKNKSSGKALKSINYTQVQLNRSDYNL